MNNKDNSVLKDIKTTNAIERQVELWDLLAKLAPTVFLGVCLVLILSNSINFDTVFTIGMVLFSLTAVTWWFWAIFSIRRLVRILNRASNGLIEVTDDLKETKKELRKYLDE